ncbi:MAG: type II toxin-antitoxin system HicB family antitoxin [Desulfocapsaceae bacterium]|nr:type II toxin-antitoxin system HicB family antitoxin [Desulfocapsaceae bacterium]
MDTINYKGYEGTAEIDMDRSVCRGKIRFIQDLITYQADTPKDLKRAFEEAVEDYLETCEALGREPQKPLKGQFNVRISPELHHAATIKAYKEGITLNALVGRAIEVFVNGHEEVNIISHFHNAPIGENPTQAWVSSSDRTPRIIPFTKEGKPDVEH